MQGTRAALSLQRCNSATHHWTLQVVVAPRALVSPQKCEARFGRKMFSPVFWHHTTSNTSIMTQSKTELVVRGDEKEDVILVAT
jgi:hypothetical protein